MLSHRTGKLNRPRLEIDGLRFGRSATGQSIGEHGLKNCVAGQDNRNSGDNSGICIVFSGNGPIIASPTHASNNYGPRGFAR